jgi:hypothetical protein
MNMNEQGYTFNAASAADRKAAGESEAGSSWKVYTDGARGEPENVLGLLDALGRRADQETRRGPAPRPAVK